MADIANRRYQPSDVDETDASANEAENETETGEGVKIVDEAWLRSAIREAASSSFSTVVATSTNHSVAQAV